MIVYAAAVSALILSFFMEDLTPELRNCCLDIENTLNLKSDATKQK